MRHTAKLLIHIGQLSGFAMKKCWDEMGTLPAACSSDVINALQPNTKRLVFSAPGIKLETK